MFARGYALVTGFDAVLGVLVQMMIHGVSPLSIAIEWCEIKAIVPPCL